MYFLFTRRGNCNPYFAILTKTGGKFLYCVKITPDYLEIEKFSHIIAV